MIDGIYTAYMTGAAGQGMAMFVFQSGKIAGADLMGLTFHGEYTVVDGRAIGTVCYSMPQGSMSITGAQFEFGSGEIVVPIDLPTEIDHAATYAIRTPIGPLNAKFVKNLSLGGEIGD